jgi:hypothetical protein
LSPLARALRGIRSTVLLFVGLLIGVLAVVKPFTRQSCSVRRWQRRLAGTKQ